MTANDDEQDQVQETVRLHVHGKHKEEQRFSDPIIWALLLAGLFGSLFTGVRGIVLGLSMWNAVISIAAAVAIAATTVALSRQHMKVKINKKGVRYEVGPFIKRRRKLKWSDVASCEIVSTPAIGEWSGSNVHFSDETVASLVGRNGLAIVMLDGRRFFVGVKNLDQLRDLFDDPGEGARVPATDP